MLAAKNWQDIDALHRWTLGQQKNAKRVLRLGPIRKAVVSNP